MGWVQLVEPNTSVSAPAGSCLAFVQSVYGAPVQYKSAWQAWENVDGKQSGRDMPPVSVPVWFSHYGTYGNPPTYDNWGHVIAWIPSEGRFISSPGSGTGSQWFDSISAVESYFRASFVGWSTYINGLQVAAGDSPTTSRIDREMIFAVVKDTGVGVVMGEFTYEEWNPTTHAQEFELSETIWGHGAARLYITDYQWQTEKALIERRKKSLPAGGAVNVDYAAIAKAVNDDASKRLAK